MPLKIRCPHCRTILLAEDWTAGEGKRCPRCGLGFTVPLPPSAVSEDAVEHIHVAAPCPTCGAEMAPGTFVCKRCQTDRRTGRRLPWHQRLRFISPRTWVLAAACLCLAIVAGSLAANLYLDRRRPPRPDATAGSAAAAAQPPQADAAVARLLGAASESERRAAVQMIREARDAGLARLTAALENMNTAALDAAGTANLLAAVELLASSGQSACAAALARLDRPERLRQAALAARGRLGDAAVGDALVRQWRELERQRIFLERVLALSAGPSAAADQAARHRANLLANESLRGLRGLTAAGGVLPPGALETYWLSWSWLGQVRGERVAEALFEMAQPPEADLEVRERVRAARRILEASAQRGPAASRAAAGLVLAHSAPQYESARGRIVAALAGDLDDPDPRVRQRVTWALARLTRRDLGGLLPDSTPDDVGAAHVRAAVEWARTQGCAVATPPRSEDYPRRPQLTRRVITPQRQLEHELLAAFRAGWEPALAALPAWRRGGLRLTPRLIALADPRQRAPSAPALGAALVLIAEYGDNEHRVELELWTLAHDQPPWVRTAAAIALAGVSQRAGGAGGADWLSRLDPAAFEPGSGAGPDWGYWGELLAASGSQVLAQLEREAGGRLSPSTRERLRAEAERAARARR